MFFFVTFYSSIFIVCCLFHCAAIRYGYYNYHNPMAAVKRCKLRRGNAYEFAIYSSILIETLGQCVSLERLSHSTGDEACLATGTAEMVVSCCLVLV